MASQAGKVAFSPLMEAYAGKEQKLECCFSSLKLEHVPHEQDAIMKELSQIAAKGRLVLAGTFIERLSKLSVAPEEVAGAPSTSMLGASPTTIPPKDAAARQANGALCPFPLAALAKRNRFKRGMVL
jgi:hypothetical protein